MQDEPTPIQILASVAAFLRDAVIPKVAQRTAFQVRVAANALDLVARQIALAPASEKGEQMRLATLLGREGTLADLNRELAKRIATGAVGPATPGFNEHLLATTLAKLAVDQPAYSGYRAALACAQAKED